MQTTKEEFKKVLQKIGINKGNVLFVHTDISKINGLGDCPRSVLCNLANGIIEVIAQTGTLAVPAYFYNYARKGIPFDIKKSPIDKALGLFPRYIHTFKGAYRSINPLSSIVAIGNEAAYLCEPETGSAFGVYSSFDKLTQLEAKMLFIGVDLSVMTYIHYVEHMVGVPYIYNKYYTIPVYDNGIEVPFPISAQVRYLRYGIQNKGWENTKRFDEVPDLVRKAKFGTDFIRVINTRQFFEFFSWELQKYFFYDLEKKPNFDPEREPIK